MLFNELSAVIIEYSGQYLYGYLHSFLETRGFCDLSSLVPLKEERAERKWDEKVTLMASLPIPVLNCLKKAITFPTP